MNLFKERVLGRKIEKYNKKRKQKNPFLQKIKMISAGKALAPRGGPASRITLSSHASHSHHTRHTLISRITLSSHASHSGACLTHRMQNLCKPVHNPCILHSVESHAKHSETSHAKHSVECAQLCRDVSECSECTAVHTPRSVLHEMSQKGARECLMQHTECTRMH